MSAIPLPTLNAPYTVLLSIHDVMPHTMDRVDELLGILARNGYRRITLLVVPGLDWHETQLRKLHDWQRDGHVLAGHGWLHRVDRRKTLYHKLHGVILSRMVAEHLSLNEAEIADLIARNYQWFAANGFVAPEIYVPPAWGMGPISKARLRDLPFRYYEFLNGIFDAHDDVFHKIHVTGFEVDTFYREHFVRLIHRLLLALRLRTGCPALRISIHPQDHQLRMAKDFHSTFELPLTTVQYTDI